MKTSVTNKPLHHAWKNLCWLTLFTVLFQAIFITGASAFSMQTPSIYTQCNHLESTHHNSKAQCMQHCATATEHYTQHYLSDSHGSIQVDHYSPAVIYINVPDNIHTARPISGHNLLSCLTYIPEGSPVYQSTARLRI